jgi:hypothetical protein
MYVCICIVTVVCGRPRYQISADINARPRAARARASETSPATPPVSSGCGLTLLASSIRPLTLVASSARPHTRARPLLQHRQ